VNTDIRLYVSFKGHRKRKKLRLVLGDRATDYLIDLWLTVAQDRPDGVLTGWNEVDVAFAAGWEAEPQRFVDALIVCQLLDQDGDTYRLHDWEEHQPWACNAAERSDNARRSANARWGRCTAHAKRMPDACTAHADGNAPLLSSPILSSPEEQDSPIPPESGQPTPQWAIFDHWNAQKIIEHRRLTDAIKRRINGALANYKPEEIVQAIDNYAFILGSAAHYFKYRWTLADFLTRGLDKFMDRRVCDANYRKDTGGNGRVAQDRRRPAPPTPDDATPDYSKRPERGAAVLPKA
jgi:hypothetical protein